MSHSVSAIKLVRDIQSLNDAIDSGRTNDLQRRGPARNSGIEIKITNVGDMIRMEMCQQNAAQLSSWNACEIRCGSRARARIYKIEMLWRFNCNTSLRTTRSR
jgi:hypothetical protein